VQFSVVVSAGAYLYTAWADARTQRSLRALWPDWDDPPFALAAGRLQAIPAQPDLRKETFLFMDNQPAEEEIYLVASERPLTRSELAKRVATGPDRAHAVQATPDPDDVQRWFKGVGVATSSSPLSNRVLVRARPGEPAVFYLPVHHVDGLRQCPSGWKVE
jgi:hypothetical protein